MDMRAGWHDHPGAGNGYAGGKRRRDEFEDDGYNKRQSLDSILAATVRLCNKQEKEEETSTADQIDALSKTIIREHHHQGGKIIQILLDCVIELSHKVPAYAALIGLINSEETSFVTALLSTAQTKLAVALQNGNRNVIRLLFRFFAALVPTNVLYASAVIQTFGTVVQTAIGMAEQGSDTSFEVWQPYADFLVCSVLIALPWGGSSLAEASEQQTTELLQEVDKYMELRPCKLNSALRPFFEGEDPASTSDSGSASFLGQLWEAIEEIQDTKKWKIESVPEYVSDLNEAKLAASTPGVLRDLEVPTQPPCLKSYAALSSPQAAAKVLTAYPPRGVIRLLPTENTWGDRPKIERLVAEEYMLDTIHYFDGDRIMCARVLALELPLTGTRDSIVTELIFSQMLRVPHPHLKPIAYATVLADVCKLLPAVPRSMSACVRELFQRMSSLDPQLRTQLAEWLAYHLSNFDFMWPWAKWTYVLQAPAHDAQRRFVVDVFSKLIRLSYYGNVLSKVPDTYKEIFPAKPEPLPLEDAPDQEMPEAVQAAQASILSPVQDLTAQEKSWARQVVAQVKQKKTAEQVENWMSESGMKQELGSATALVRASLAGLLTAGSKSFTHMLLALERYDDLLIHLLDDAKDEGRRAMVDTAVTVWQKSPQRAAQAVDRLMAHRLVSGADILNWVFQWSGFNSLNIQLQNGLAWEIIYNAVNKTLARTQDARDELLEAEAAMPQSNALEVKGDSADVQERLLAVVDDREIEAKKNIVEKEGQLAEARKDETDLFTLCLKLFRDSLSQSTDGASLDGERAEWQRYTTAQLRSFTRRYCTPLSAIAGDLQDIFARDATDQSAKDAFKHSLAL